MPIGPRAITVGALASFAFLLAAAGTAQADATLPLEPLRAPSEMTASSPLSSPPLRAAPEPATHWYGWQTLVADAVPTTLFAASSAPVSGAQGPFFLAGLATFGLGGPAVHGAHGRWKVAALDLGLRVGAVLTAGAVGLMVGEATANSRSCTATSVYGPAVDCSFSPIDHLVAGTLIGGAVGGIAASAIDSAVLSREASRPHSDDPPPPDFSWSPTVSALRGGAAAGLTGTF